MKPIATYLLLLLLIPFLSSCAGPKYTATSTASLQLRHQQCAEWLQAASERSHIVNISFGPPQPQMPWVHPYQDHVREKEAIEVELLKRWQTGDRAAWLPIFEPTIGQSKRVNSQ